MSDSFNKLLVYETDSVLSAVKKIETSRIQCVCVMSSKNVLLGLISNGDLRRFLLHGGNLQTPVTKCMNANFRYVNENASKEDLLKLLDLGFCVIPKLDQKGCLIDLIINDASLLIFFSDDDNLL